MTIRPWTFPLLTFLLCAIFFIGIKSAHDAGFRDGVQQERDDKAKHDEFMRDIGLCDWSKIMAKSVKCELQNRTEPRNRDPS